MITYLDRYHEKLPITIQEMYGILELFDKKFYE
jgi:hypothetical protein